jgi:hypothetical protein
MLGLCRLLMACSGMPFKPFCPLSLLQIVSATMQGNPALLRVIVACLGLGLGLGLLPLLLYGVPRSPSTLSACMQSPHTRAYGQATHACTHARGREVWD